MEQRWMSQRFFLFFFTWGVFVPYGAVWLNGHGATIEEAGIIVSIGLIVRGLSQLIIFPYFTTRTTVMKLQFWIPFLSIGILLLFPFGSSFWYLTLVMVLFSLVYPMQMPLNETSASLLTKLPNFNYGMSRQFGSVGFIVALSLTGVFISSFGSDSILTLLIGGSVILAIHSWLNAPKDFSTLGTATSIKDWKKLLSNKQFMAILAVVVLVTASHAIYNTFAATYVVSLGAPSQWVGFILTLAVLAEIICFIFAEKWFGHLSTRTLLIIGSCTAILRWTINALVPTLFVFTISLLLHSITFAMVHLGFMWFTSRHIPTHLIPSAQGMYAALGGSFVLGLMTMATSSIYASSPSLSYLIMSGIACIALLIALFLVPKEKIKEEVQ